MSYVYSSRGMGEGESWGSILGGFGSILEPLAVGGAMVYSDYAKTRIAKKETKARQAEVAAALEQRQREAELQAALSQVRAVAGSQTAQAVVAGGVLLGTLGLVGYLLTRKKK